MLRHHDPVRDVEAQAAVLAHVPGGEEQLDDARL
jgi:hypothetical protein